MIIRLKNLFPDKNKFISSKSVRPFDLILERKKGNVIELEGNEDNILDFIEDYFDCEPEDAPSYFIVLSI